MINKDMIKTKSELMAEISAENLKEHTSNNIELKRSWDSKHGKKISALCNKTAYEKMWFIIGVDDDGTIYGHDEAWAKTTEEAISQSLNKKLDPILACESITCEAVHSKWFIVIELRNPGAVVNWEGIPYKASGTTSERMSPAEAMQLTMELPGLIDYSRQKSTHDLNVDLVSIFCDDVRAQNSDLKADTDDENLLRKIKIRSTNAEKILLGKTQFRLVKTNKEGEIIENKSYYGLYHILTPSFFDEIKGWYSSNNPRSELLSDTILKESLANAVAHSAYTENHGEIVIELHADKLSVSNLCFPEYAVFANKWFSRIHKSPNSFLMETLRMVKKVDELGRGKSVIFSESLKSGFRVPVVEITDVGRFNRWTLNIYCGSSDNRNMRIYEKIKEHYRDTNKALVAFALVLWRDIPVSKILDYFGAEEHKLLAEVLSDLDGPIFYYKKEDTIILNRWVRLIIEEGCESKTFTPFEEEQLYKFMRDMQKYQGDLFTPKDLRRLAHMSESSSERTLSSKIINNWEQGKKIEKIKRGLYKFTSAEEMSRTEQALKLLELFEKQIREKEGT